ncbi:MAG TPA: efflux RND transporter permease subunit [Acidobacteriota bacterium]|nr:efflux RND transporter permease subunit [Acidobacteriota bacterium]
MNIPEIFIRRPIMTTLVMIGILIFGIMAYELLPVSDLPNVDFPVIQVTANLPGASPETMASAVATPLERQFSTIAGLDSMSSTNTQGTTNISLVFNLNRSLDAAAQDVQTAIARTQSQLPRDMPSPPTSSKVNPADQPVLYIALTSPTLPLSTLDEYGETIMAQRISTVSGVAQVQVFGSQKYAVRVQVDPKELVARGIGIDEVADSIQHSNVNLPTGTLYGPHKAFTVQTSGQLLTADAYKPMIVTYRKGSPVRLQDIAVVSDSVENNKTAAWFVNKDHANRSVVLAVSKQPGTNTVAVADAVRRLLPLFKEQIPASAELNILYDRSESIRESVNDVKFTLVLTLCLVIMVIFLFLRNLSATVIPSLALPMSIIGTFSVMYLLDYSLDNLSLMALTLSVGFVVDDAIVMLENIVRHMEMGKGRLQAALDGSREVGFTIVSMTISLAAVFIPVLFMGGIVGRLFHEFAVTIGMAVLISGFVSLTLTPMLCSRFLKAVEPSQHGKWYKKSEKIFEDSISFYGRTLKWALNHRVFTMIVWIVTFVATGVLFVIIPKGFLPTTDQNLLRCFTEAAQGISFESMVQHQQALMKIVQADENVNSFFSTAGARGFTGSNSGIIFMRLKPKNQRKLTADQIVQELRPKLASVPGIRCYLLVPPPIQIGGTVTKSLYQFTLQSPDFQDLYHYAPILEDKIRQIPGLQDVNSDLQIKNPQVNIDIDRDKASTLGISAQQIEDALYYAYGSRQISTIYAPNNEYQVILELQPQYQRDPSALSMLYVNSANKQLVPLDALAKLRPTLGPMSVNHSGQLPAVNISFNLAPNVSIGTAVGEVNRLARQTLPSTVTTAFQGTAQAFQSSSSGTLVLLIIAVLVIYMVLGILYESFIHPITILTALPPAGFGALATLMIFHEDLSIYALIGIIMLIGLVKKNGIMMVDFAMDAQRNEGKNPVDAIYSASIVRFRPIMMTTMAALLGTLPIALGFGAGAEARRPLGLAVVGGLIFSQTLTLYITPVFYVYMDKFQAWLGKGLSGKKEGKPELSVLTEPKPEMFGTYRKSNL